MQTTPRIQRMLYGTRGKRDVKRTHNLFVDDLKVYQ